MSKKLTKLWPFVKNFDGNQIRNGSKKLEGADWAIFPEFLPVLEAKPRSLTMAHKAVAALLVAAGASAFTPLARTSARQQVIRQIDITLTDPLLLGGGAVAAIAATSPLWLMKPATTEGQKKGSGCRDTF
jgi:hypothetical protein